MKDFKGIQVPRIEDIYEDTVFGENLRRVDHCEETGLYLFGRYDKEDGRLMSWELVKGRKDKQPDGSIVLTYPRTSDWGTYGWTYPSRTKEETLRKALRIADKKARKALIHKEMPAPKYLKDGKINPKWVKEQNK